MRLESEKKAGFYPIHPDCVPLIAERLRPPSGPWSLVDPCCGKAEALGLFASALSCPHVYGAELDGDRAKAARAHLPGATIVGPADFLAMKLTHRAFSFAWCNPPYANGESGYGDRIEVHFLLRVSAALMPGGILAALVPERLMQEDRWREPEFRRIVRQNFENILCCPLPEEHRHYNEVVVFGVRKESLQEASPSAVRHATFADSCLPVYNIPVGEACRTFEKTEPTPQEVEAMLQASPLNRLFASPDEKPLRRPPLALGPQHIALLLASGQLDGYVDDGRGGHVVRGSSRKEGYLRESRSEQDRNGNEVEVSVFSEKLKVFVRVISASGAIEDHT